MKVGYLKYCGGMDCDLKFLGPGGETEVTLALWKEMIERGWDLTLYSFLNSRSEQFYKDVCDGEVTSPDVQWLKKLKLKYKGKQLIDSDTDLVIVSNGPTNTNFRDAHWGIPAISRTNWLLSQYRGVVFYKQTDPELFFVFFPEMYSKKYWNENGGQWGSCAELQRGKKWLITTPMRRLKGTFATGKTPKPFTFNDSYAMVRPNYKALQPDVAHLEYHWSVVHGLAQFQLNPDPIPGVAYIGRERGRNAKFRAFYNTLAEQGVPVHVYGKGATVGQVLPGGWKNRTKDSMPKIKWSGQAPIGKVQETYNKYLAHVVIGDKTYEKFQMFSSRFLETIVARIIPLVDEALDLATGDIINTPDLKKLLLVNPANVKAKFDVIKSLSFNDRKALNDQLVNNLSKFGPHTVADNIEKLYKQQRQILDDPNYVDKSAHAWKIFHQMCQDKLSNKDPTKKWFGEFLLKYAADNYDQQGNFVGDRNKPVRQVIKNSGLANCVRCGAEMKRRGVYAARIVCKACKGQPELEDEVEQEDEENGLLSLFDSKPSLLEEEEAEGEADDTGLDEDEEDRRDLV